MQSDQTYHSITEVDRSVLQQGDMLMVWVCTQEHPCKLFDIINQTVLLIYGLGILKLLGDILENKGDPK